MLKKVSVCDASLTYIEWLDFGNWHKEKWKNSLT